MELVVAIIAGYAIGLLQNGININHKQPEVEMDEKGEPIYNESISALSEEQEQWINENRQI